MAGIKISRNDIRPTKMAAKPLQCIVDSNYKIICSNKNNEVGVYEYVGIGWIFLRKPTEEDYNNLPTVID